MGLQNLTMTRGDSQSWAFQVLASTPSGVNLQGHGGIAFTAKRSVADIDASAILRKSLASGATSGASGIVITDFISGRGTITLASADTAALEAAIVQLSYDLQYVDASGNKYTVAAGRLIVRPDVTLS